MRLNETEKRAAFAEKSVKSYVAELDMREGKRRLVRFQIVVKKQRFNTNFIFQSDFAKKKKSLSTCVMTWIQRSLN